MLWHEYVRHEAVLPSPCPRCVAIGCCEAASAVGAPAPQPKHRAQAPLPRPCWLKAESANSCAPYTDAFAA